VLAQREDHTVKLLPQLRERHTASPGIHRGTGAERYPQAYAYYLARDLDYDFETGESLRGLPNASARALTGWCGITVDRRLRRSATAACST